MISNDLHTDTYFSR